VCETVNTLEADLVCHTGDIADGTAERRRAQAAPLGTVQATRARVYVTNGKNDPGFRTKPQIGAALARHRRDGRSPSRAFWGRLVLAEELGGLADDLELGFQLTDPSTRCTQLCGLLREPARPSAVVDVDVVLAQPLRSSRPCPGTMPDNEWTSL
jgi:hypothetical protein